MNKVRVYLDTSVISYLDQQDSPNKMEQTKKVWRMLKSNKYEILISSLVFSEIDECRKDKRDILKSYLSKIHYKRININEETYQFANEIIKNEILKPKSFDDCLHIALAILNNCNLILSWNFKHIVNIKTINGIRKLTFNRNLKSIDIYSPDILLKGGKLL